jgi:chemotaxis protein methyltransferase CheR
MNNKYEIGVVDTRNVINVIWDAYGYNFKDYALTSLKYRLERIIRMYGMRDAEVLANRLYDDEKFFDVFLSELAVETTESFRDPGMWRYLMEEIISAGANKTGRYKIWVGGCESGDELYSLMILLKEADLIDKVEVFCTCLSERSIEKVKSGVFGVKKLETNEANYKRANGVGELTDYYKIDNNNPYWDTDLIKNVNFTKTDLNFEGIPKSVNLVIFRNRMIYYNQPYQDKVLGFIHDAILPGGYLLIGAKETLEHSLYDKRFKIINQKERVYKKNLS